MPTAKILATRTKIEYPDTLSTMNSVGVQRTAKPVADAAEIARGRCEGDFVVIVGLVTVLFGDCIIDLYVRFACYVHKCPNAALLARKTPCPDQSRGTVSRQ